MDKNCNSFISNIRSIFRNILLISHYKTIFSRHFDTHYFGLFSLHVASLQSLKLCFTVQNSWLNPLQLISVTLYWIGRIINSDYDIHLDLCFPQQSLYKVSQIPPKCCFLVCAVRTLCDNQTLNCPAETVLLPLFLN